MSNTCFHLEEYNFSTKKYSANIIYELTTKVTNKIYYLRSTFHKNSFSFYPELPLIGIYFYALI